MHSTCDPKFLPTIQFQHGPVNSSKCFLIVEATSFSVEQWPNAFLTTSLTTSCNFSSKFVERMVTSGDRNTFAVTALCHRRDCRLSWLNRCLPNIIYAFYETGNINKLIWFKLIFIDAHNSHLLHRQFIRFIWQKATCPNNIQKLWKLNLNN